MSHLPRARFEKMSHSLFSFFNFFFGCFIFVFFTGHFYDFIAKRICTVWFMRHATRYFLQVIFGEFFCQTEKRRILDAF